MAKMLVRKAYKFRLKTNAEIEKCLERFAGHCRFVWNQFWRINLSRLQNKQPIIRYHEMAFWLKLWKQSDERLFLKEAHSQVLQQKLMDLDRAYRDAFDRNQPRKWLPRLRRKLLHNSFRYVQGFKVDGRRMFLPKIGWVGFFKSQEINGELKNLTISKSHDEWYGSVQVEEEIDLAPAPENPTGIDLGIAKLATLSDGTVYEPKNFYRRRQAALARAQRKLSKKPKGSQNRKKSLKKVRGVHRKTVNARNDYSHKTSNVISKNHATIYLEKLGVSKLSKSARGTIDDPGRNVRAKSGLSKSILDQGWSKLSRQLVYKSAWRNGKVIFVDPRFTSQICSCCGFKSSQNRQTQSKFVCLKCGFELNADINAARNILYRGQQMAAGQAVSVCGEVLIAASMKQKPVGSRKTVPPN